MSDKTIVEKINTDSIKISRNAKGDYAWEIKAYGDCAVKIRDKLKMLQATAEELTVVVG